LREDFNKKNLSPARSELERSGSALSNPSFSPISVRRQQPALRVNPQEKQIVSQDFTICAKDYFEPLSHYKILHYIYKKTLYYLDFKNFRKEAPLKSTDPLKWTGKYFNNLLSKTHWKQFRFKIDSSSGQVPSGFRSIVLPNSDIYLVGGSFNGVTSNHVFKFNYFSSRFERLAQGMVKEREQFGLAYLSGNLLAVGGYSDRLLSCMRECEAFDLVSKQWVSVAPLNQPSKMMSVCTFDEYYLYKIGGYQNERRDLPSCVERFDPQENLWKEIQLQVDYKFQSLPQFQNLALSASC